MKVNKLFIALCLSANSYALYAGGPIEPVMVTIPAGSFEMGSMDYNNAQPLHKVDMPEFSMGKYEVTVNEFRQFIRATNYPASKECRHELNGWFRPGSKGNWETNALNTSEYQPVVCITWQDANAYVKWLAKETGKPYRLPSEAEWEYAARAGTKTNYYFGDDSDNTLVCDYENTGDLSGENILQRDSNTSYYNWTGEIADCADHSGYASIVGMYKANPFGLHDMVSNIREMLADCYSGDYSKASSDGSANLEGSCESRAIRGSSWHWSHWPLVQRNSFPEDFAGGVDGFRLALDGKAPKLSKASKRFLARLTFAQEQEQKRRNIQPEFPQAVTNVTLQQTSDAVTISWDKSKESDVESYRVYRNEIAGGMFKLLASNLTQTSYTDSNVSPYKYDYTVVAVKYHKQGHYSEPVSTKAGWVNVPGRVEAQWASDYSGSELTQTSDVDGGYNFTGVGGISDNASLKYQVEVAKAGLYQLEYRVASPRDTKGFELYANDEKAGVNQVVKTGGYHEWQTQQGKAVYLKKGKNTVTVKSLDNNWKLNWLTLKQG
ncbi:SUMF1/EgtB/PvdO family nonheme iron enzyme [Thalassomonas sp. RHCl1]|uniref:SUMF1/EgtB/PvdO family nonheme iron enzyme n=1 Tax=Thalassomonas sp. RHCl1 TaxID=2995320 RepID=UPI00248D2DEE|nr:SUMF1/EgtB/PvdO family nonheme iron enzyme [Thalassomonas sp. RHCl1]